MKAVCREEIVLTVVAVGEKMRSLRYKREGKAENLGKIVKTTVRDKEKFFPILGKTTL